jgi:hypothetical protein
MGVRVTARLRKALHATGFCVSLKPGTLRWHVPFGMDIEPGVERKGMIMAGGDDQSDRVGVLGWRKGRLTL